MSNQLVDLASILIQRKKYKEMIDATIELWKHYLLGRFASHDAMITQKWFLPTQYLLEFK